VSGRLRNQLADFQESWQEGGESWQRGPLVQTLHGGVDGAMPTGIHRSIIDECVDNWYVLQKTTSTLYIGLSFSTFLRLKIQTIENVVKVLRPMCFWLQERS
jgi:hypothetical protein